MSGEKMWVTETATGQRLERWPVDVTDLLKLGGYTTDTPLTETDSVTVIPEIEQVVALGIQAAGASSTDDVIRPNVVAPPRVVPKAKK